MLTTLSAPELENISVQPSFSPDFATSTGLHTDLYPGRDDGLEYRSTTSTRPFVLSRVFILSNQVAVTLTVADRDSPLLWSDCAPIAG